MCLTGVFRKCFCFSSLMLRNGKTGSRSINETEKLDRSSFTPKNSKLRPQASQKFGKIKSYKDTMNNITINLEILEARNLIDADKSISSMLQSNDTSDPYVAVMLMGLEDDEKKEIDQTDVVKDNVNPVWKHTMTKKHIDLNKTGVLRLAVRDYDKFSKDSKIGNVDLPLVGLIGKGKIEGWFKLQRRTKW